MKSSLTATPAALLRRTPGANLLQWRRARRTPTRQAARRGCCRGEPCQWSALQRRNTERPQTASRLRPPPRRPPREHHEWLGRSRRQHSRPPHRRHPRQAIPSLNSPRSPCMIISMRRSTRRCPPTPPLAHGRPRHTARGGHARRPCSPRPPQGSRVWCGPTVRRRCSATTGACARWRGVYQMQRAGRTLHPLRVLCGKQFRRRRR